jgi:hypothetical protein
VARSGRNGALLYDSVCEWTKDNTYILSHTYIVPHYGDVEKIHLWLSIDLEFAPWHENASIDHHENHTGGYHGWTDGSRRISAEFGWSFHAYND